MNQINITISLEYTGYIPIQCGKKKLRTPLPRGSSLCEGMGEGCCTQPYPCICKEAVSGFEPMTNKSPRHNFTAAPGLALMSPMENCHKSAGPL